MTADPDLPLVGPVFGRSSRSVRARRSKALRLAADVVSTRSTAPLEIVHGARRAALPREVAELLVDVLKGLDAGEPLTLVVGEAEPDAVVTSKQAAQLLNVSRPHVVKLARTDALPCSKVGNRHRFRLADVLAFQQSEKGRRQALLATMEPDGGFSANDY